MASDYSKLTDDEIKQAFRDNVEAMNNIEQAIAEHRRNPIPANRAASDQLIASHHKTRDALEKERETLLELARKRNLRL